MNLSLKKLFIIKTTLLLFFVILVGDTTALTSIGQKIVVNEEGVREGHVISLTKDGYYFPRKDYDPNIAGVISSDQGVYLESIEETGQVTYNLVSSGTVNVLVNSENGNVQTGDLITSSINAPGIAKKATRPGFMIGKALADFDPNGGSIQSIPVSLDIGIAAPNGEDLNINQLGTGTSFFPQVSQSLLTLADISVENASQHPNKGMLYIIATLIALITTFFGYFLFGRVATNGLTALGRNPLAKNSILIGILINTFLTITVIGIGLGVAYFLVTV